jgi:hypothetical protein
MIAVGVAVLCLAAVAALLLADQPKSGSAQHTPSIATSTVANSPAAAAQAHQVAVALSRLATDPDSLVASSSRGQVAGRAREGVPIGSTIQVNEASWEPDGAGGGVIAVTVRSPALPPVTYAVVMVLEGGRWKVIATVPAAGVTPSSTSGPTR